MQKGSFLKLFLSLCVFAVQKIVHNWCINKLVFTHNAQLVLILKNSVGFYTFIYSTITQRLHKIVAQFISVNYDFYTIYTRPITITIYNI